MTSRIAKKRQSKIHRHRRVRAVVHGVPARPRLAVFRSLKHIQAQIVDDEARRTLVAASDRELAAKKGTKMERASAVGTLLAEKAKSKNITAVVFDRGGLKYHGRIKALADAARHAGLTF